MDSENSKVVSCSKKRNKHSSLPFLPDEIIFTILVWLPADILYNVMRYVCRGWHNIIKNPDFVQTNLHHSTAGLFFQRPVHPYSAVFAEVADCDDQIRKIRFEFPVAVTASCDGFILFREKWRGVFCIANPVTKQRVTLPPLPLRRGCHYHSAFVYIPSLKRYKVVHTCRDVDFMNPCLVVLTVGADKAWRLINLQHVSSSVRRVLSPVPLSVGKFVFWASPTEPDILVLDLETETISELPGPRGIVVRERKQRYQAMGSKLCLVDSVAAFQWQVWVLEMELGEWIKLFNLDLTGERYSVFMKRMSLGIVDEDLFPTLWLRNGEVVVFNSWYRLRPIVLIHSVKTGEFIWFEKEDNDAGQSCLAHVNSLLSLEEKF